MEIEKKIADMRVNYTRGVLDEHMVDPNPTHQFRKWFNEAVECEVNEPNIMILSTVTKENKPSSRVVLLKDITDNGFTFFTNYNSNKGKEIDLNNNVALLFLWVELQRQVRIEGIASKLPEEESRTYFKSRPIESQIGAILSNQSSFVEKRSDLDQAYKKLYEEYQNGRLIEKPTNWGGYIVNPQSFEFWQGRSSRLHDRIHFQKSDMNGWITKRLAP